MLTQATGSALVVVTATNAMRSLWNPASQLTFRVVRFLISPFLKNLLVQPERPRCLISIKHEDRTVIEIPLTVGLIGTLLVPWLAAIGAISTVLTHCTVEVERIERADDPPMD